MSTSVESERLPLWLRAAEWPWRTRLALLGGVTCAFALLLALCPPEVAAASRPVNLLLVVTGGIFFGLRGGGAYALLLVVLNVSVYWHEGILGGSGATLSGNVLSIIFGTLTGVVVGHVRDLSLKLREQIGLRVQAERRRDELTALLVHDLKNPLTGIGGHAQLLAEEHTDGPTLESLQYIRSSAERMTRMVVNLLDIGRAEDGALRPSYQQVELPRLLEDVQAAVQPQLLARGQTLAVIQAGDDPRMDADPDLLRRLLLNLVENAIKYTPKGSQVRLEVDGSDEAVELCVRDQGPGIPAGMEDRVFDKYARLDRERGTAPDASRGLGLHFCKLAASAHGGRIWVEPNPPEGSAFRIRLPRTPPAA